MVGIRPYFFSVGQSFGPIRSKPLAPSRAASLAFSSSVLPLPNTPPVTHCFSRPLRTTAVSSADASADANATPGEASAGTNVRLVIIRYRLEVHAQAELPSPHLRERL